MKPTTSFQTGVSLVHIPITRFVPVLTLCYPVHSLDSGRHEQFCLKSSATRSLRGPFREGHHLPWECCDSSFCFMVTRTRSSEERVLSTATLRTMLPFNPVSPACFDPLTVMM